MYRFNLNLRWFDKNAKILLVVLFWWILQGRKGKESTKTETPMPMAIPMTEKVEGEIWTNARDHELDAPTIDSDYQFSPYLIFVSEIRVSGSSNLGKRLRKWETRMLQKWKRLGFTTFWVSEIENGREKGKSRIRERYWFCGFSKGFSLLNFQIWNA